MESNTLVDAIVKTPEYMTASITSVGAIVGAVVAVVAGLLTAWITNRQNRRLLAQQLESESRERQRERQVNLRRDVYLPAADAVVSLSSAMGKMVSGDAAAAEQLMTVTQAFGAALTRMQMVASIETVRHVAEYQRAALKAIGFIQRRYHALMLLRADINVAQDSREGHQAERARFIEMMKACNIEGARDRARFERIQRQSDFVEQLRAEAHGAWLRHVRAFETARLEMIGEFITHLTELSRLQVPVLAAIRRELETGEDSHAVIAEEAENTASVGQQGIRDMIPLIEAGIERFSAEIAADEQRQREQQALRR